MALLLRSATRLSGGAAARRCMSTVPLSEDQSMTPNIVHAPASFGEVQVETLANGVTVVTEDGTTPTSKVTIVVAAGSRNEGIENAGISHVMKALAFQSATTRSALAIERQTASVGAQLKCNADREVVSYSANFIRKDLESVVTNLSEATTNQAFRTWEVSDVKKAIDTSVSTKALVVDALHAGAFRRTLGNSTTVAPYSLNNITAESLSEYAEKYFTSGNMTVVGSGVDHSELVALVEEKFADVTTEDSPAMSAEYYGGFESRNATGNGETAFAVAYEGVASGSEDSYASHVLAAIIDGSAVVPYGSSTPIEVLNFNYTDSGLFGIYVTSAGEAASDDVSAAVGTLKSTISGDFSDQDVTKAKNKIRNAILDKSPAERADFYATQAISTKTPLTPEAFADAIEAVTVADVKALAAKMAKTKPVVASAGNVAYAPYASELGL